MLLNYHTEITGADGPNTRFNIPGLHTILEKPHPRLQLLLVFDGVFRMGGHRLLLFGLTLDGLCEACIDIFDIWLLVGI